LFSLEETWLLNNRVNLRLLDHLSDAQFAYMANSRARSIGDQFAHLHNVRTMWLEVCSKTHLPKIEKGYATKERVAEFLTASAEAMAQMFMQAEMTGKLTGYKRGPIAFCGYMLAHEAHHRGQIILHLKQAKMSVDKMFGFSLWEWEKI